MSVRERRECDVFKGRAAIRYEICVTIADLPENSGRIDEQVAFRERDLSPRAVDRLLSFIEKGIHPPGWKPDETVPASRQQPPGPQRGVSG